jgi:hypothetical protein
LVRPPAARRGIDPRSERRLGFLEQHDRRVAGPGGRLQGELARGLVERGRHGDQHLLLGERRAGVRVVPGVADVAEDQRLGLDRRDLLAIAAPRQDRGLAVDPGVA